MIRENVTQYCIAGFWTWLKWNFLIPFMFPVFVYYLSIPFLSANAKVMINPAEVILFLFNNGIFIFMGSALLLDLFVDYKEYSGSFNRVKFVFIGLLLFYTAVMFIGSLRITDLIEPPGFGVQFLIICLCLSVSYGIKHSIFTVKFKKEKYYGF